jgi:hypothetical protein
MGDTIFAFTKSRNRGIGLALQSMQNNSKDRPLHHKLDIRAFHDITLRNLWTGYLKFAPDATEEQCVDEILNKVNAHDHPGIDEPLGILRSVSSKDDLEKGDDWITTSPIGTIIVSCAYVLRASRAHKHGNTEIAWSYMADARFWCGAAIADKGIGEVIEQTRANSGSEAARHANNGRQRAYSIHRRMAWRLARRKRPPQRGWPSLPHAAKIIRGPFLEFLDAVVTANAKRAERNKSLPQKQPKKLVVVPKTANIEEQLERWLKEMPDRDQIFPPAKTGRPKKAEDPSSA